MNDEHVNDDIIPMSRRGRPPGSKNKPKTPPPQEAQSPGVVHKEEDEPKEPKDDAPKEREGNEPEEQPKPPVSPQTMAAVTAVAGVVAAMVSRQDWGEFGGKTRTTVALDLDTSGSTNKPHIQQQWAEFGPAMVTATAMTPEGRLRLDAIFRHCSSGVEIKHLGPAKGWCCRGPRHSG